MNGNGSERGADIRWRRLVTYVLVAYLGAWLVVLPLWLGDGLRSPLARPLLIAMMLTPTVAAVVTVRLWPDGRRMVDVLGLRPGPFRRWWWTLLIGWLGPPVLVVAAVTLAVVCGVFPVDWGTWSTFRATLPTQSLPMSTTSLLVITLLSSTLVNVWIGAVPAVGEEIGWRGFLRDELSVLPRWALIVITGLIWGLWHAPIILLGYNYPGLPPAIALACMVVFTTLVAALLEWLRTVGTAIWPTALAHGSINTAASLALLLVPLRHPLGALSGGLLGWPGWLVMALVIVVLVATGALQLRSRPSEEIRAGGPPRPAPTVSSARSGPESDREGGAGPWPDPDGSGGR